MSRTRGGRKRASPPSSGAISSHSASSVVRQPDSCETARRTKAPSSATAPDAREPLQRRGESRARAVAAAATAAGARVRCPAGRDFPRGRRDALREVPTAEASQRSGSMRDRGAAGLQKRQVQRFGERLGLRVRQRMIAAERPPVPVIGRRRQERAKRLRRRPEGERIELQPPLRRAPLAGRGAQVEKPAAAQRALRRDVADDEAVAAPRGDRPVQHELHVAVAAGANGSSSSSTIRAPDLGRRMMQAHRKPLADRLRLAGQQPQLASIRSVGACSAGSSTMSPRWIASLVISVAREIERAAIAGPAVFGGAVLRMQRAHPRRQAGRADRDLVADAHRARQHRAGHDDAGSGQREDAIDREPEAPRGAIGHALSPRPTKSRSRSASMPCAGQRGDRQNVRAVQRRVRQAPLRSRRVDVRERVPAMTRSALVSATSAASMPSRSMIARCSSVCGLHPSSAATTSSAKSMPLAPASMVCTKRS